MVFRPVSWNIIPQGGALDKGGFSVDEPGVGIELMTHDLCKTQICRSLLSLSMGIEPSDLCRMERERYQLNQLTPLEPKHSVTEGTGN